MTISEDEATEIHLAWLNLQFEQNPGMVYCVTCDRLTSDEAEEHKGHILAKNMDEATSKMVMARLKGDI